MCGIIHCKKLDKKNVNKIVKKRFEEQKHRGTEGFGYVELKNGIVIGTVRTETEKECMKYLSKSIADEILFHHRIPTSTPNFIEATHPIRVSHKDLKYDYYIMHNGIISNDSELRVKHLENNYVYNTEISKEWITKSNKYIEKIWNDSEALCIDLAIAIESGKSIEARGSIAVVALQFEKKSKKAVALYYGHNEGNPLTIESKKDFFSITSEAGIALPEDFLYRYDYATKETTNERKNIGTYKDKYKQYYQDELKWNDYQTSFGNYEDEEDDFNIEDFETIKWYEEEMRKASQAGDFDEATMIQVELDDYKLDIESRKKLKKEGKLKHIGF